MLISNAILTDAPDETLDLPEDLKNLQLPEHITLIDSYIQTCLDSYPLDVTVSREVALILAKIKVLYLEVLTSCITQLNDKVNSSAQSVDPTS